METLQSTIFIEFDVNTKKITFLRGDNIIDYDSNTTSVYVRVKYKNLSGNTVYLTPSELEDYKFSLYTIKPATNNVNVITGEVTDELKENVYGGVVKFEIPRTCTNRLGIVKCEIHINQRKKIIGSSTFVLDVKQSLVTAFDDELLGDEDFPVLKQLILEIQKASNIDDNNRSKITTYSSDKIEDIRRDLNLQIKKKANENELDVERKRIDSFTALAEGSTTGDAELIDARIGANGVTYDNVGSSIRTQIKQIKKNDYNILYTTKRPKNLIVRDELIEGRYVNTNGIEQQGDDWCVTNYIYIGDLEKYYRFNTGLTCYYDENKNFISYTQEQDKEITIPDGVKYMRVSVLKEYVDYACIFREDLPTSENDYGIVTDTYMGIENIHAELIDARIDVNGVAHENVGGAIRTQIKQIKKDDYNILYTTKKAKNLIVRDELIEGRYVNTSGVEEPGDDWCVTNYIYIGDMEKHYKLNTGLTCYYDENKNFISYYQPAVGDKEMIHPEGAKYIRVSVLKEYVDYACIFREDLDISENDYGIVSDKALGIEDINAELIDARIGANGVVYDNVGTSIREQIKEIKKDDFKYKPYQSGFIPFTVTINENMPIMTGTDDISLDPNNTIDVDCVLSLPTSYRPYGKPTKLLMMCHGAGKGVSGDNNWTLDPNYNNLVKAFVENGYAVFDCNGYDNTANGFNFWGAQRGIDTWKKAYQYVVNNYNVEKTFSIYGFSMGGCTALNIAMQKFPGIKNIAISSPVINLKAIWDEGLTGGARGAMNIAYGFDVAHDTFEDIMAMNSPYEKIKTIGDKKYCFNYLPPIKVWFGSTETDQNGVNKQYAAELVEALKNAGTYAIYREVDGRGHEICYGEDLNIIPEYVTWINRFS